MPDPFAGSSGHDSASRETVVDFDGHYASIVNGTAVTSPTTAPVYNPATRQVIAKVPVTTRAQLDDPNGR